MKIKKPAFWPKNPYEPSDRTKGGSPLGTQRTEEKRYLASIWNRASDEIWEAIISTGIDIADFVGLGAMAKTLREHQEEETKHKQNTEPEKINE